MEQIITTRSEAQKIAQKKYREKNRLKYNESQRELYKKQMENPEWKDNRTKQARVYNKTYRDKKALSVIELLIVQ